MSNPSSNKPVNNKINEAKKGCNKKISLIKRLSNKFKPKKFEIYSISIFSESMQDYLKYRLKEQIDWYEEKANNHRREYYIFQFMIISIGALIPIINTINVNPNDSSIRLWSSILGGSIVISSGVLQLTKSYENWVSYRSTAEVLKSEYFLYYTNSDIYEEKDIEKRDRIFIKRIESIITSEGSKFLQYHQNNMPSYSPSENK
jgi:hypothetical protein